MGKNNSRNFKTNKVTSNDVIFHVFSKDLISKSFSCPNYYHYHQKKFHKEKSATTLFMCTLSTPLLAGGRAQVMHYTQQARTPPLSHLSIPRMHFHKVDRDKSYSTALVACKVKLRKTNWCSLISSFVFHASEILSHIKRTQCDFYFTNEN